MTGMAASGGCSLPNALSDEEAAGLPLAGLTALQGLRDHGRMAPGARVLVVGASGGVGNLAIQIATQDGAAVTAVCGPDNIEWVGGLGAERVLNYRENGWLPKAGSFDLIFDAVGSLGCSRCRRHLERGGTYVTTLPGPRAFFDSLLRAPLSGRRAKTFLVKQSGTDLRDLLAMQSAGKLRLSIDSVFDWENCADAFARCESGRAKGKIVLRVARNDG